jgi:pimeloyl-ACP methyl ester carboxylesterase
VALASRTALVDGLKIFYRDPGDPKAPTVLLLHGFSTSSQIAVIICDFLDRESEAKPAQDRYA